jgi:predicted O-methyltransferase YrrM
MSTRIKLRRNARTQTLVYEQQGGNQSAVDAQGVSLDTYIHALFGLVMQTRAKKVLMIGCAGGTLATMLHRTGVRVTAVDVDKASFTLARKYFGLPKAVRCHVDDGLAYMQRTRAKFDAVIVDAFIGEKVPAQFTGDEFCIAAKRCLKRSGAVLVNVCLDGRADRTADALALKLKQHGWRTRLLDEPGPQRNAIVMAGNVRGLKRPKLIIAPQLRVGDIKRTLKVMRFRRALNRHHPT